MDDFFVAKLQSITIANGYNYDVGPDRVYLVPTLSLELAPPALVYRPLGDLPPRQKEGDRYHNFVHFAVAFMTTLDQAVAKTIAQNLRGDIRKALADRSALVSVPYRTGTSPAPVTLEWIQLGSRWWVGAPLEGMVWGTQEYLCEFDSSIYDPYSV